MTNPHKGEVEFVAGGRPYVLVFTVDALVAMENAAGAIDGLKRKGFHKIVADLANPDTLSIELVRVVLWAALRERQPEVTVKEAGELMVAAGGMVASLAKINEAFAASFPEAQPLADPPLPGQKNGTGSASAAPGAV